MAIEKLFKLYNVYALSMLESYYDNIGGRAYKGAPSQTTDAKKKRKRKEQRIARRKNRK